MGQVQIIVRDARRDIVDTLVSDAQARDVTMQEAAVAILASTFGVKREPSARRYVVSGLSNELHLEVPTSLRQKLRRRALALDGTIRGVILATIAQHYGLPEVPTGRRPRGGTGSGSD